MERRMLKLGGRSCGDGMEGAVWKELEGMDGMDGRSGMEGMDTSVRDNELYLKAL